MSVASDIVRARVVHRARELFHRWGIDSYGLEDAGTRLSMVESVIHELCHAACLGIHFGPKLSIRIADEIRVLPNVAADYQEIMTMAAEVLVVERLGLPITRKSIFEDGATKPSYIDYDTAIRLMERLSHTKTARKRAEKVFATLTKFNQGKSISGGELECTTETVSSLPTC